MSIHLLHPPNLAPDAKMKQPKAASSLSNNPVFFPIKAGLFLYLSPKKACQM
jgi:hypothetical protein